MAYGQTNATTTDMAKVLSGYALTDRALNAVLNFLNGLNKEDACEAAGYAKGSSGMVFRSAKVQAAIAATMDRFMLGELAPGALHVLSRLLYDEKVAAGVRKDIAFGLLDRSGFSAKRHERPEGTGKDPSQMTTTELQEQIDKLEAQIVAKMRDITPVDAPSAEQDVDLYP